MPCIGSICECPRAVLSTSWQAHASENSLGKRGKAPSLFPIKGLYFVCVK